VSSADRQQEPIEDLVQRSSLGTPGARALKSRSSRREAQLLHQATRLRNELVHGQRQPLELGLVLEELGALDEAIAFYEMLAATSLHRLAEVHRRRGDYDEAKAWEIRAQMLDRP